LPGLVLVPIDFERTSWPELQPVFLDSHCLSVLLVAPGR